jgi:hypothetical protein
MVMEHKMQRERLDLDFCGRPLLITHGPLGASVDDDVSVSIGDQLINDLMSISAFD